MSVRTSFASPCSILSGDNSTRAGTEVVSSPPRAADESVFICFSLTCDFHESTGSPGPGDATRYMGRRKHAADSFQENSQREAIHKREAANSGRRIALNP